MEENSKPKKCCCAAVPNGVWALLCVVVFGIFLLLTVNTFKSADNKVSVRGLCEREVMADRAIYPVSYKETGDDLQQLYNSVNTKNEQIVNFLKQNGFSDEEITVNAPQITDNYSNSYSREAPTRYVITSIITVYTTKVSDVIALQSKQASLIGEGIAIGSGNEWENPVEFEYVGLNEIKPEMIEEANQNARKAAEQFAKDSHSRLGKITEASQGLFTVESRDSNTPQVKRVRVVTSVTYHLK